MKRQIIKSGDGSHTIRIEALKENYHSHKGAIQESRHVFIEMGLKQFPADARISMLEVGFGTGLNALLTALEKDDRTMNYVGLEIDPLDWELVGQLNYSSVIGTSEAQMLFQSMHEATWETPVEITAGFQLEKRKQAIENLEAEEAFDLVYYDAFAPHAQPELWVPAIWEGLYRAMRPNALLVTYCAKGQVRRDMQAAGFEVERLPGPPGKREMLRARKSPTLTLRQAAPSLKLRRKRSG